ncbi:MAG: hypothetical protein KC586_21135 [Myxococcales bacterium]|nr:hypothetical protein [Myxococcales bacterium]
MELAHAERSGRQRWFSCSFGFFDLDRQRRRRRLVGGLDRRVTRQALDFRGVVFV